MNELHICDEVTFETTNVETLSVGEVAPTPTAVDAPPPDPRSPPRRRRRRGQAGLTLIEILVVVTILGLIAGIVGVTVVRQLDETKKNTAGIQIKELSNAIDLFRVKVGRYPNTTEGLNALTNPPGGRPAIMDSIPKDPWESEYIYVSPGTHLPGKFDLYSKGPNGVADDEDDITNWQKQ